MYLKGFINGLVILLLMVVLFFTLGEILDKDWNEFTLFFMIILSWCYSGYFYKKSYGPFMLSQDGKAQSRLMQFLLGVGTSWGPASLYVNNFPISGSHPIMNLTLLLISVPMMGISIAGILFLGGLFYKDKT